MIVYECAFSASVTGATAAGGLWQLARGRALDPAGALDWMHDRADRAAQHLTGRPAAAFAAWARNRPIQQAQRAILAAGRPVSLTVPADDVCRGRDVRVTYRLSAHARTLLITTHPLVLPDTAAAAPPPPPGPGPHRQDEGTTTPTSRRTTP